MTDEELKKKAEEYSKDHNTVVCCDCSYYDSEEDIEEAYLAGAKELQKENEQLKQELLTYKNAICNKECAEVWGESERLKKENEQLKQQLTKGRDILFEFVKIACETFSEGCPECDYCFLDEVKQKTEVFFKALAE
ncbi:MAG: hypothetical protein J6B11_10375 [Spirochaetales bacterium]|nr:hypothetical protein [Spirochaetales bacterium]